MGTLVFQATLGGAINLIGPNTASTVNFTLPSADGTNGQALTTNGSGTLAFTTVTAAPGGSTTQVQYNNAGAFGGITGATTNGTALTLTGAILNGTIGATTPSTGAFTTLSATTSAEVNGTYPKIYLIETDVAADNKQWWFESNAGVFQARVLNDAVSAATTWLSATRSGATITQAVLNASTGGNVYQKINNTTVTDVSSTGLAVTGLVDISAATSGQIKFPASQNASSNANTLDDYEEGTWTPTVIGTTVAGTASYTTQTGVYTKIGQLVSVSCRVDYSGGTGLGNLRISGLPFTSANNIQRPLAIEVGDISLGAGAYCVASIITNNTAVSLASCPTGGAAAPSTTYDGSGYIIFNGTYTV